MCVRKSTSGRTNEAGDDLTGGGGGAAGGSDAGNSPCRTFSRGCPSAPVGPPGSGGLPGCSLSLHGARRPGTPGPRLVLRRGTAACAEPMGSRGVRWHRRPRTSTYSPAVQVRRGNQSRSINPHLDSIPKNQSFQVKRRHAQGPQTHTLCFAVTSRSPRKP